MAPRRATCGRFRGHQAAGLQAAHPQRPLEDIAGELGFSFTCAESHCKPLSLLCIDDYVESLTYLPPVTLDMMTKGQQVSSTTLQSQKVACFPLDSNLG